jgi:MFS family permease
MAFFISLFTLAQFATDGLGLSQANGAALQSILAATRLVGPVLGYASDRAGRINIPILCYLLAGLSCLCMWMTAKSFGALIAFALVQGSVAGVVWSTAPAVTATIVGLNELDPALTTFWCIVVVPALVAQPIAVALIDYSKNTLHCSGSDAYEISIGFCGGLGLLAATFLFGAKHKVQNGWTIFQRA